MVFPLPDVPTTLMRSKERICCAAAVSPMRLMMVPGRSKILLPPWRPRDRIHPERQTGHRKVGGEHASALGDPRRTQAHRNQIRLRHRAVRRLHRAPRRQGRARVRHPAFCCCRKTNYYDRRPVAGFGAPAAESLGRRGSAAVRLLPVGPDHEGRRAARREQEALARADRHAHERQYLPLRDLPPHHRGDPARVEGGVTMDRREFFKVTGGLTFAFTFGVHAQTGSEKPFNAWVRIAPDGTVTIYSAGAEMGQGSMTSLPLIVADEMDADWWKVKIEWAPADAAVYGYTFNKARGMAIVGSRAVMLYYNDLRVA